MMRAAIYRSFGGPIRIENAEKPTNPAPDSVIVQVKATGVCRSDWHGWKGHDGDIKEHGLPFCPGHELSGIVVEVGAEVTKFRYGDRVAVPFILSCGSCEYCHKGRPTICSKQQQPGFTQWGSFAEFVVLPRADRNLTLIPNSVSFVQAAALGCRFTTAYRAVLQQGGLLDSKKETKSIAIFGCGGLGLSCIMIAVAAAGISAPIIIAVDVSTDALAMARDLGATHTVQATKIKGSNQEVQRQVKQITNGQGVDLSIDAAGFPSTCENAVHCLRPGGRMVQVGLPIGDIKPEIPMGVVAGKELELVGSHGFAAEDLPDLLQMVADGKLDPAKLVKKEVSLEEGVQAIEDMDHGSPLGITVVTKFKAEQSRL